MTRKQRKKDENPAASAMEANLEQATSKLAAASSLASAPHIVALPAPEEAIELVRAAMKVDSTQISLDSNETGNFPLLESSAKCANPRVYAAMRLKSGKILPSTPTTNSKKHALPDEQHDLNGSTPATLSELFLSEQNCEPVLFDEMSLNNVVSGSSNSSFRVESVGLPENLDISFAFQNSGGVDELRIAGSVSEKDGFTTSCGPHLGVEQATLGGKNLVSSATMPMSGATAKVAGSEASGAGAGAVGALASEAEGLDMDALASTCGRACPVGQGTPREVDPVATEVNAGVRPASPVKDAPLGQNADKALHGVASWVEMVRKNRMNSEEVVKLVDCVEGITEDSVFLEDEDLTDDSLEKLCLIGIFPSKFPGRDAVQKIVNAWPKKCRFNYHNSGWIVFVFEAESDLAEVMNAGPYYAFGKPLLLKKMPALFDFSKEACTTVPVWIQLPNLPLRLWKDKPLSKICSFLGSPQYTDKMTATKKVLSFARCLVEVDLKMNLPTAIPITFPDGRVLMQPVLYEDMPKFCSKCSRLGHSAAGHDNAKDDAPALYVMRNRKPEVKKTGTKKKKVIVEEPGVRAHTVGKTRHAQSAVSRAETESRAKGKEHVVECDEDVLDDEEDVPRENLMAGTSGIRVSGAMSRHVQNLSPEDNPRSVSETRAQVDLAGAGAGLNVVHGVQEDGVSVGNRVQKVSEGQARHAQILSPETSCRSGLQTRAQVELAAAAGVRAGLDAQIGGGKDCLVGECFADGAPLAESVLVQKQCPETCPRACPGSGACPDLGTLSDAEANNSDTPLANTFSVLSPIQGRNWADEVDNEEIEDTPAPASKSKGKKQKKGSRAGSDVGKTAKNYVLRGASPLRRQG